MANLKPTETPKQKGKLGGFLEGLGFMLTRNPHIKQLTISSEDFEESELEENDKKSEENDFEGIEEE
jgi:hypothetical protein